MTADPIGIHAKTGDVLVGWLADPIGMYRDEVYLRDLSPELQALLRAALEPQPVFNDAHWRYDLVEAARAFAKSVRP